MPELPEVETIARQLDAVLVGQVIKNVEVRREKSFVGKPQELVGERIRKVWRRAKMVVVELGPRTQPFDHAQDKRLASSYLLIHLKMTGQLIYDENDQIPNFKLQKSFKNHKPHFKVADRILGGHPTPDWVKALPSSHTRVIFELSRGRLFFNDQRVFGWIKIMESSKFPAKGWSASGGKVQMATLPPDVVDKEFIVGYLAEVLRKTGRAVKLTITDQAKMGGVGNIYANDALWEARIDPRRGARTLRGVEVRRLHRAIKKVIQAGIKYGGATASDDKFVQATGLGGKYQEHFLVYDRAGERCRRRGRVPDGARRGRVSDGTRRGCGGRIRRITLGGRGTFYCPECQH